MDQEYQRNKPKKGHSERTGLNDGWLRREKTVLEDGHIRKNILAQYNPWTKGIYTQPPPYNYIWQQQTIKEYAKTSHPSSSWTKQHGYTLGGSEPKTKDKEYKKLKTTTTTTHQDSSSDFFSKEKNSEKARGCGIHSPRIFWKQESGPSNFCKQKQEARGLHSVSAIFMKNCTHQKRTRT